MATIAEYKGPSVHDRQISTADWKNAGFEGVPAKRWFEGNGYIQDVSDYPADALARLKKDPDFKVTESPNEESEDELTDEEQEVFEEDAQDG